MRWLLVLLMFVAILALFYWLALASPWSGAFVSGGRIVRRGGSRNACGRAAAGYGEWMGGFHAPGRAMAVIVCGVLLLPFAPYPSAPQAHTSLGEPIPTLRTACFNSA
jgi:hypothetical protein